MKDTVGILLRERWKEKGNPYCQHPELSRERSFSGTLTGALPLYDLRKVDRKPNAGEAGVGNERIRPKLNGKENSLAVKQRASPE